MEISLIIQKIVKSIIDLNNIMRMLFFTAAAIAAATFASYGQAVKLEFVS